MIFSQWLYKFKSEEPDTKPEAAEQEDVMDSSEGNKKVNGFLIILFEK
jgi:hypothetical protein